MNNKKINYRYKFLLTFVTLILILLFMGVWTLGAYVLYKESNINGFQWITALFIVGLLLIIGVEVFTYAVYEKLMKKIFICVDNIMETFPVSERSALEEVSCGDDTILLQKALEWFSYRQIQSDRAHFAATTTGALASFSHEIFWEYGFLGNSLNYGDYWENTYGENRLFELTSIDELLEAGAQEKFRQCVSDAKKIVGKHFAFDATIRIGKTKHIRVRVVGTSAVAFGEVILFGVIRDVEQISSLREAFEEGRREKEYILLNTQDRTFYEVDITTNKMTILNKSPETALFDLSNFTDYEKERSGYWSFIHPDYLEGFIDRFITYDHLLVLPEQTLSYEYQIKTKNNDWIWVRHSVRAVKSDGDCVKKVVGCIYNITEKKREELKELYSTNNDSLTGALQWPSLLEEYNSFVARYGKRKAVIVFDIDNFRQLNQQYGFEFGNKILRLVVMKLWERQLEKCLVGRIKNDEFVVLMLEADEAEASPEKLIKSVFDEFNDPRKIDGRLINICITAGYAFQSEEDEFEIDYNSAKQALRKCRREKKNGTNAYLAHDEYAEEI